MRATREPRILFNVPAQSFHLALDVVVTDDQLRGQVSDGVGHPKPFSGWLGLIAALWPQAWLALFSPDPRVIETGSAYLRIVGPAYGFFGLGMALYFASQGAARLFWPLMSGTLRVIVAIGGGWLALYITDSLNWLFAALALGLIVYGVALTAAIRSGEWFGRERSE